MFHYSRPVHSVPWESLRDCYGPATDVPRVLEDFVSDEADVLDDAYGWMLGNAWYQGTIFEVTGYIVEFLVDLVCGGSTSARRRAANCLALFAISAAHTPDEPDSARVLTQLSKHAERLAQVAATNESLRAVIVRSLAQLHAERPRIRAVLATCGITPNWDAG
jgi:hypothetical protein